MNSLKISRQIFGITGILVANSRNSGIKIIKRNASIRTGNYYIQKYQLEHIGPLGWSLLVCKNCFTNKYCLVSLTRDLF